ncbi:MAG: band 7 protein [Acidobacteria bacterium]|nr:band 7 protein [Acidobacteriota bacterium]
MFTDLNVVVVIAGLCLAFILAVYAVARRYKKVGPNQVMIISGRKYKIKTPDGRVEEVGFRIRRGGGAFILPLIEKIDLLSLEIMTLDITTPEVYTRPGVPIIVDGVAQVKVGGDEESIRTSSEQFLGKTPEQIKEIAMQTVEGHLRAIVGTMTVEDIYKNRDQFASSVQEVAVSDLANMGLHIVSFTLKDIRDNHGYLEALGKPRTAEVKRDAIIAQAEADRDSTIKSAAARQAGEIAKFQAETQIAEAQKNFLLRKAGYDASTNEAKAQADLAYDLQRYKTNQSLKREEVQIAVVEKEQQIVVQEREILRREKELEATVKRLADAERYRVQTEAEATRFKYEAEARGQAEAQKAKGFAQAEVVKATGLAEADVIAVKGGSEAEAMAKKAASWKEYNQAAVTQLILQALPEIAQAIAQPLSKTQSITIVNTGGDGGGAGASKVTRDVAEIMAQLPPIVENLAGLDIKKLVDLVPQLKADKPAKQVEES